MIRFLPLIEKMARKHKRPVGGSWRMDETYIKIKGVWKYLYRAVDKQGKTVDFLLRITAGSRLSTAKKLSTTVLVVALSILASTTKPVARSTSVPTEERLPAPLIRSPSQ